MWAKEEGSWRDLEICVSPKVCVWGDGDSLLSPSLESRGAGAPLPPPLFLRLGYDVYSYFKGCFRLLQLTHCMQPQIGDGLPRAIVARSNYMMSESLACGSVHSSMSHRLVATGSPERWLPRPASIIKTRRAVGSRLSKGTDSHRTGSLELERHFES